LRIYCVSIASLPVLWLEAMILRSGEMEYGCIWVNGWMGGWIDGLLFGWVD